MTTLGRGCRDSSPLVWCSSRFIQPRQVLFSICIDISAIRDHKLYLSLTPVLGLEHLCFTQMKSYPSGTF
jgi:hypothetical protein